MKKLNLDNFKLNMRITRAVIGIRLRLFWYNVIRPKKKIIGAAIVGLVILVAIAAAVSHYYNSQDKYFYKDYDGNVGVSRKCEVAASTLICDKKNGGKIEVREYWRNK